MNTQETELLSQLVNDLTDAAQTFRHYERLHRAKETEDGLLKAEANAALAGRLEASIKRAALFL